MIQTLLGMIALGTIGFWITIALYIILCMAFLERYDEDREADFNPFFAIVLTVLAVILFYFGGPIKELFGWAAENKLKMFLCVVGYFAVGCLYSMMKFWCFLQRIKERYLSYKVEWMTEELGPIMGGTERDYEVTPIPENRKKAWMDYLQHVCSYPGLVYNYATGKLKVSQYKTIITTWIIWWPISGIWFVINDPVRRIANWLFEKFKGLYAKMYRASLGKIAEDMTGEK